MEDIYVNRHHYVKLDGVILTIREAETCQAILFTDGSERKVAEVLKINPITVRHYYGRLKKKLGYYSTDQLIAGIHKKYGEQHEMAHA